MTENDIIQHIRQTRPKQIARKSIWEEQVLVMRLQMSLTLSSATKLTPAAGGLGPEEAKAKPCMHAIKVQAKR